MPKYDISVKMYDTDMAGIIYFASQFRFAHDAFERFMQDNGASIRQLFLHEPYIFVIVNANSDYLAPLQIGDDLEVDLYISKIGRSSVTVGYDIYKKENGQLVGRVSTTHVCLDKASRQSQEIPLAIKDKLIANLRS